MLNKIARYTKAMAEDFPFWSKVKDSPLQTTAIEFLNIFGFKLDDAESLIQYMFKQNYINTADTEYIHYVYKSIIPVSLESSDIIYLKNDGVLLDRCRSFEEFYVSLNDNIYDHINKQDPYIIDTKTSSIYMSKEYPNLTCVVNNEKSFRLKTRRQAVWNMFDELGDLVSLKRLPNEDNVSYKARIKDVFVHPPSSTKTGLLNSLARELGLRKTYKWEHPSFDYVIRDKNVLVDTISLILSNGTTQTPEVLINDDGDIFIEGINGFVGDLYISYATGFSVHDVNDIDDYFIKMFYYDNSNTANMYFNKKIRQLRKNRLDNFTWDQTYEQKQNKKVMKSKCDASTDGFLKYNNLSVEDVIEKVRREVGI